MKTNRVSYCLLAALSGLAAAQEPAPQPGVEIKGHGGATIVTEGADGKKEVRTFEFTDDGDGPTVTIDGVPMDGAAAIGKAAAGILQLADGSGSLHLSAGPGEGPAAGAMMKIRELAEPIRWTIGGDNFDAPVRSGPVTFLGVSAIPVPRELAVHLPLAEDTGLGVEGIVPGSPAEKAGLEKSDVLMKLDDQILIHPRQLNVLVANHKEGDSVKLTYLRKGEVKEVTVSLAKRDVPPGEAGKDVIFHSFGSAAPLRTFTRRFDVPGGAPEAHVQEVEKELRHAKESLQKQAEEMRKDADAQVAEVKKRVLDGKLHEEVRRAAEAAYSAEVQRAGPRRPPRPRKRIPARRSMNCARSWIRY